MARVPAEHRKYSCEEDTPTLHSWYLRTMGTQRCGPYLGLHHGDGQEGFLEEGRSKCHVLNEQRTLSNQKKKRGGVDKKELCDQWSIWTLRCKGTHCGGALLTTTVEERVPGSMDIWSRAVVLKRPYECVLHLHFPGYYAQHKCAAKATGGTESHVLTQKVWVHTSLRMNHVVIWHILWCWKQFVY